MNWEIVFVAALIIFALWSFILEKISSDTTAILIFGTILAVGGFTHSDHLPSGADVLGVFANPAPLTIAAMFVLSSALEKCGLIEILASQMEKAASWGYRGALLALILVVAVGSAFVNNTAIVIVLMPVVLALARKMSMPASKFLIPLSYASIFGGCCTLIGTSTNILASGILQKQDYEPISMFELTPVALPILGVGTLYLLLFGRKLLPTRETLTSMLSDEERKEYITEAYIPYGSPLASKPLGNTPLVKSKGMRLMEVIRRGIALPGTNHDMILEAGDRLVLACKPASIVKAHSMEGVELQTHLGEGVEQIASHQGAIVEGVIGPTSPLLGKSVQEVNFRQHMRMILLAVHRKGVNVRDHLGQLRFQFGDTLLMMGSERAIDSLRGSDEIILLDRPAVPAQDMRKKIPIGLGIFAAMLTVVTLEILPMATASLIAVAAMLVTRCISTKEAYKSIDWSILMLIYGMLAMGMCMQDSGLAQMLAEKILFTLQSLPDHYPKVYLLIGTIYLLTATLTEMLSNNATVVLMTPLALGLATAMGVDPRPFVIATCIASSASFSTPIGYQTNTYVYGVGGYKFSDFWKIGLPLNLIYFVGCTLLIPELF